MLLSSLSKTKLEATGIIISQTKDRYHLRKKFGIGGNTLPMPRKTTYARVNEKEEFTEEDIMLDSPVLYLQVKETEFILTCWNWTPGPGPGDFEKEFTNENLLVDFILSYYFGDNEYFKERKRYEEKLINKNDSTGQH